MQDELEAFENNGTWEITILLKGKKAIASNQVYKRKYRPYGTIERLKGRLIFRGDKQIKGKDYKHVFSPVAKFTTVRTLIALASMQGWRMHHDKQCFTTWTYRRSNLYGIPKGLC